MLGEGDVGDLGVLNYLLSISRLVGIGVAFAGADEIAGAISLSWMTSWLSALSRICSRRSSVFFLSIVSSSRRICSICMIVSPSPLSLGAEASECKTALMSAALMVYSRVVVGLGRSSVTYCSLSTSIYVIEGTLGILAYYENMSLLSTTILTCPL